MFSFVVFEQVHQRNEAHGIFANKDLFAVNESVQREALKNFYEQRARVKVPKAIKFVTELDNCQVEKKKLRNAKLIGVWGVPIFVFIFVVTYWILGMENYINPKMVMEEEKEEEEEGSSLWMILGVIGLIVAVFAALLCWFYPTISSRLQAKKTTKLGLQQSTIASN